MFGRELVDQTGAGCFAGDVPGWDAEIVAVCGTGVDGYEG